MVKGLPGLLLAILLLLADTAWAAIRLQAVPQTLALGEPLTVTLESGDTPLEALDLTPLSRAFEIHGRTLSRGGGGEILTLTLYPLRSGRLALPALGSGRQATRPLIVNVLDQSDTMPRVDVSLSLQPERPLVRQPARLTLEICDDGSLVWQRPALPTHGALILRPLGEQQVDVDRGDRRCTAHRYHWALLATAPGGVRLPLPMLEAGKFGRRLRLPTPALDFTATPVPAWLPLHVAVGLPQMQGQPWPRKWPVDRPLAWRVTVTGGYSPEGLKSLLALQAQAHPALAAYPPTIQELPWEDDAALTTLAATLYVLPDKTGPLSLATLSLPYYDPARQRLEYLRLPAPQVDIVNPLAERLLTFLAILAALVALFALAYGLRRLLGWRIARRRALDGLARAENLAALAHQLRALHLHGPRPAAPTLEVWLERTPGDTLCAGLPELVTAVEAALYGREAETFARLRQQALKVVGGMRPRRRSWAPGPEA